MDIFKGKEIEGKIGDAGTYSLDVTEDGKVLFEADVKKEFGYGKASSTTTLETDIFAIAEMMAKKTKTPWDDAAVATLERLLGIKKA